MELQMHLGINPMGVIIFSLFYLVRVGYAQTLVQESSSQDSTSITDSALIENAVSENNDSGFFLGGRWVPKQEEAAPRKPTVEKNQGTRRVIKILTAVSATSFALSGAAYLSIKNNCEDFEILVKSEKECREEADEERAFILPYIIGSLAVCAASLLGFCVFPDR